MPMNDFRRENRLHRAGKVRLGYKIKKCPECKEQIVVKKKAVDGCPKCKADLREVAVYPTSTPYFVLDDAPELIEIYGEQPIRLNIYFPFDTIDENMPAFHKFRQASSLVCQGDGTKITYAINPQTGKPIIRDGIALVDFEESGADGKRIQFHRGEFMPCPGREHDAYKKCSFCRPNTTLRFLVREVPRMAYFEISTNSIHNHLMLSGQLSYYTTPEPEGLGIGLKYVPFYLDLRPSMISVPNLDRNGNPKKGPDGKPQPKVMMEKYLLSLEIEPAFMARLTRAKRQLMDPVRLMLSAPMPAADDWVDDGEDFDDEEEASSPAVVIIPPPAATGPEPTKAEPAPTQEPKTEPPAANGKAKLPRPMTPEQLKSSLAAPRYAGAKSPKEEEVDFAISLFSRACGGDNQRLQIVSVFLFGQEGVKKLTSGQIAFLNEWLGATAENNYQPDPNALVEIESIVHHQSQTAKADESAPPPPAEQPAEREPAADWWNRVDPVEATQAELFNTPQ